MLGTLLVYSTEFVPYDKKGKMDKYTPSESAMYKHIYIKCKWKYNIGSRGHFSNKLINSAYGAVLMILVPLQSMVQ